MVADLKGSNVNIVKTSSYQDMTHPRVSSDKNWLAYTTYNNKNSSGCASLDQGYLNTEIRAVKISGANDKRIIEPSPTDFNTNNYWIGATNEFTFLSGPVSSLKFYRATVDSNMDLALAPTQIAVIGTITVPMDPQANTTKIVFPGLYDPGGGFIKSIFMMNLSDSSNLVGLSVGRDHAGTPIICADADCLNIMENDPKISPDGTKVAFMRQAPSSGDNGFGWHIFVVPVASPQNEVDISYSHLGSDILKNDVLPEWIDNDTLIFSTIEIASASSIAKNVYTMKTDGTQRLKVSLPDGFRYADVYPFTDASGNQKMILSAEKIDATCF
ncbi:MAG: PD40 domain-containing protein [Bdellovibrionaceae bacterium]|nr:PD40 domain-containing protein [Pseudobdellovibrionaceae bacterium]